MNVTPMRARKRLVWLIGVITLGGCSEPPTKPDTASLVPSEWRQTMSSGNMSAGAGATNAVASNTDAGAGASLGSSNMGNAPAAQSTPAGVCANPAPCAPDVLTAEWWNGFGSTELADVVQRALDGSNDIASAIAREHQAAAQARIAGAPLWPQIVAGATANRQTGGAGDVTVQNGNSFTANISASYEVDFWGKNRALERAAEAGYKASQFDRDTVRLTTAANAASLWIQIVAQRERAAIATRNVESARQILTLIETQARAGSASPLDVAQQRRLVASERRVATALEQGSHDDEATLAVLLGIPVQHLELGAQSLDGLQIRAIDAGIPSTLLTRRPDIASAEAQLEAADANIEAARAAMLPSLTLGAGAGYASGAINTLFNTPLYSLAAGLTAPIFEGGQLRGERDLAIAQREALLAQYRSTIVAAYGDVDKAMNAIAGTDAQRVAENEALQQAQRAETLAQSRYRAGAETMLTVLNTQQTLFTEQDLTVQLKQARLQADISLFRALGGGWKTPD